MNDEQFEAAMDYLGDEGQVSITQQLRARDTAQREALARVEAERDTAIVQMQNIRTNRDRLNKQLGDAEFNLCIAHQQLVEAVGLIDQHFNDLGDACCSFESQHDVDTVTRFLDVLQAFLARHAQGEQQEARQETLEEILNSPCAPCEEEAQGAQAGDERALFESDPAFVGMNFIRAEGHPEYYDSPFVNGAWEGWQARASLCIKNGESKS